jgi:hypothetical protein
VSTAPLPAAGGTAPTVLTPSPSTSPVAEPNPLANAITSFLGSANVQKVLGLVQVGVAASTNAEGKSLGMHVSNITLGAAFTLGVHWFDYLRAKIGR